MRRFKEINAVSHRLHFEKFFYEKFYIYFLLFFIRFFAVRVQI